MKIKVITQETSFMEEIKKKDKEELRETRFNNKIMEKIDTAYFILPEAIVIIKANEKEQLGVYIKEENIAKLQKSIFEEIWKTGK